MARSTDKANQTTQPHTIPEGALHPVPGGYAGAAADRLAAYDALFAHLRGRVRDIPAELLQLKAQGRERSVRFRELAGERMGYLAWLEIAEGFGLGE